MDVLTETSRISVGPTPHGVGGLKFVGDVHEHTHGHVPPRTGWVD